MNKFSFVVPMFNASKTVHRMLASVVAQSYDNWRLILIDDVSSEDEVKKCEEIIANFESLLNLTNQDPSKLTVVWNHKNGRGKKWEVSNVLHGISLCDDNDIICRLDADDWLIDLDCLSLLNTVYNDVADYEAVWTMHRWGFTDRNISGSLPAEVDVYTYPWVSSHFKTFRKKMLNNVPYENFLNQNGELIKRAGDQAIYLPILHKTQKRLFLPRVMYHYNIVDNAGSIYATADALFQKAEADFIRQRGYITQGIAWDKFTAL